MSIAALRILIAKDQIVLKDNALKPDLEEALTKLSNEAKDSFIAKKSIKLPSFNVIDYKLAKGTVFLKTLQLLKACGCSQKYLDENPSR